VHRSSVKILIVDDHTVLRTGLRSFLEKQQGFEIVGEANTGRVAIELAERLLPDVVVMDIGMPDLNGLEAALEAARRLKSIDPDIKVIALSMHADERYVIGMFDAGAKGYLLKTCDSEELVRAIDAVRRGRIYVTPEVAHILVDANRRRSGEDAAPKSILTAKEREVLQLLAEGLTSKEIAARLGMSVKTTETHRGHIMKKLDLHSIAELTRYAIREGITSL
jgi:DNA-binding NarL/FixJ family response regulator